MKLNIEIESGTFEKVISDGIKSLSPEEVGDLIKQALLEALTKCEEFKDLLIVRDKIGWSNTSEIKLGPLASAAIKSIDLEPDISEFKKKMVDALMVHHREMVEDMMMRLLIEKITYSDSLRGAIEETVRRVLYEARNNGRLQ
ncbi:MAG: hypothetical protein IJG84_11480 [Kiritimatiellae bacterium]|nr:hypothetical protein [Kiritimatiellia bacterium]